MRFGNLAIILLSLSIFSYGFSGLSFAQESPADCDPKTQVFQKGKCLDIDEPDTAPFILETEQSSYVTDDTIKISGIITSLNENYVQPVTLVLVGPSGNIVKVDQVNPYENIERESRIIARFPKRIIFWILQTLESIYIFSERKFDSIIL